jgi:hypothetical protein
LRVSTSESFSTAVNAAGATTVELVVKLAASATRGSAEHRAVLARVADLGVVLEPVEPSGVDAELGTYHVARVAPRAADRVVTQLLAVPDIEAAYIKPSGGPPVGGMHHAE